MPSTAASEEDIEPSLKGSDSELDISDVDGDGDGDGVEDEEEEVEEEEEEGEEEEEEEEEEAQEENDDEGNSADLSDSPSAATNDDRNDSSQEIESEGHDGGRSLEKIEENLASDIHDLEDSDGQFDDCSSEPLATPVEDQSHVIDGGSKHQISGEGVISTEGNGFSESLVDNKGIGAWSEKKAPFEARANVTIGDDKGHSGNRDHLNKSDSIGVDNSQSSCFAEKEIAAETLLRENSGCKVSNPDGETKQMDMHSGEDVKLRESSLITPKLRTRSLSPVAEIEDRNKRPAIICDFFAKGWCIKGSACRFLHQKDRVDNTSNNCATGNVAASSSKDELEEDAGLRKEAEKSGISSLSEPQTSSVANYPSSSSNFPSRAIAGSESRGNFQQLTSDDPRHVSSYKDVDQENPKQIQFLDKYDRHASPVVQGDFAKFVSPSGALLAKPSSSESQWKSSIGEEYNRSFGIPMLHDNRNHFSEPMDSKRSISEEFVRGYPLSRNNLVPESRLFSSGSIISSSIYGNSSNSFAYGRSIVEPPSLRLENQSMVHDAHTSPRFSSSLNPTFNASLPSTGLSPMCRTFALPGSSPSQGSSPLRPLKPLDSDWGYYASRSSSLPRRSSSPFYSRSEQENLSRHSLPADPLVSTGYITQSTANAWEPSVPFRPSFHFPSIISSPRNQYDPLLDSIEPAVGGGRSRQSSFGQEATIQNLSPHQTNGDSTSFYQQPQCGALDNHMTAAEATVTSVADQQNKSSSSKEEKLLKTGYVVNASNANEVGLDHNLRHPTDGVKHNKESKSLKFFRASLVDFVKELLKPSWREGHLSKDAHNMIVKKAVEKVLSALQPHQIPSTTESIDQYLLSSRPKLAKLVEGYVGKYAKS